MLRPSASRAKRSTFTPTRMRNGESVRKGKSAQMARNVRKRGPGPTRSKARRAGAVSPVWYSVRSSCCSTHSSVPMRGMSALDLLQHRRSEEPARADEHDGDEDPEDDQVLERGRDVARREGLR